jgi:hypothetical protein
MNILASNSKRVNIRVFLSFFLSLLASFLPSCGPLVGSTLRSTRGSSSRELFGEDVGLVGDDVRGAGMERIPLYSKCGTVGTMS